MKRNHLIWMLIGCTIPLLLIFLAPSLGLSGNYSLLIFVVIMLACHLLMPHNHREHKDHSSSKKPLDEQHQH